MLAAVVLITGLALWLHWENQALMVTEIQVTCPDLPESFSGYRIAQISDLHNTEFGEDNHRLLAMMRQTKPDIIVLTGDLADSRKTDLEVAVAFGKEAAKIAPTYYVTGNHEERMFDYWKLRVGLYAGGVTLLENRAVSLEKNGETVTKNVSSDFFKLLLADILRFYNSGKTSFDTKQTLDIIKIREAVVAGKDKLGEWISL